MDLQGRTVKGFAGSVSLQSSADALIGNGTLSWTFPLGTFYHDARTQSIYLASEIGGPGRIIGLALDITSVPPQVLNNWTIRMKQTALASYTTYEWEAPSSGWVTVYQQNQSISTTGLVTFTFSTPFDYDGTSNLMIDFSFNNSSYTANGQSRYTSTPSTRTLYYQTDSEFGDPLTWSGASSPTPNFAAQVPNIRLVKTSQVSVFPATSGSFADGVWSGTIAVSPPQAAIVVVANDGAGHIGASNPFDAVVLDFPVITSPTSALAVIGQPFSYQIVATAFPGSFNATGLPANLAIDVATGLITGTPVLAGNVSVNLSATNPVGTGATALSLFAQDDFDGDGVGDVWESAHGLDPANATDAGLDKDGDGQSNRDEWISGTSPDDPNSRFAIAAFARVPAGIEITWNSTVGKRYRVLTRTSLTSGSWIDVTPVAVVAVGSTTTWTHLNGQMASSRFYRVEVVR
jgi:hypothetical protein